MSHPLADDPEKIAADPPVPSLRDAELDGAGTDFERFAAKQSASPGLVVEFLDFLKYNKKWWLLPIVAVLLLLGLFILLSTTAAAPFIYTLF